MVDVIIPPTMGAAIGFITSDPMPLSQTDGDKTDGDRRDVFCHESEVFAAEAVGSACAPHF
jgi:hypothetical protein